VLLALAAAPLFAAFAWQSTVATVSDDSVSYLLLARWLAGSLEPELAPWVAWHTHFPPLFPLLLAVAGAGHDLLAAHLVVAASAVASAFLAARYAALRLASEWGGFWVAAAFLALPTAWLSAKGILSETLFLALTLGALLAHEKWISPGRARLSGYVAFAALLAAADSTRAAGITLVAAYVVHEAIVAMRTRRFVPASVLPLAAVAACATAWMVSRPGGYAYNETVRQVLGTWMHRPGVALEFTLQAMPAGWVSAFFAEGDVAPALRGVAFAVGAAALAGSVRAALANRLDGWYVLFTAALVFAWVFGIENMRRLLYPIVPLALLHAAELVIALVRRARLRHARYAIAGICAAPLVASLPATLLIAQKSRDRGPFVEGSRYTAADITDYYRLMNLPYARMLAGKHAATLGGLEAIEKATPPGARVMWMRPEYVAMLGRREAVPYYYAWDARAFATHVRDDRADYVVVAGMAKSDLALSSGNPAAALGYAAPYTRPVVRLANPVNGRDEFLLLQVDRAALDAYLAAR
jgi:hypothetical protein